MSMVTGASELTAHGVISVGWAALVLAEAADVRTALLLGDDLLLGAGRPGPTVQWRTRDGKTGIRTAPGRVSVSAEVSAAAQGDRFGDGDLLARSAVVAAAALAEASGAVVLTLSGSALPGLATTPAQVEVQLKPASRRVRCSPTTCG